MERDIMCLKALQRLCNKSFETRIKVSLTDITWVQEIFVFLWRQTYVTLFNNNTKRVRLFTDSEIDTRINKTKSEGFFFAI